MAGDWIKLEHATPDKPEVYRLARMLGVSRGDAFLLAVEWWIWLDRNSRNGNVTHLVTQDVDDLMRCPGFAASMNAVGWLSLDDANQTLAIPNFDRHNGKTAKDRALTKDRVARNRNDDVTQESLPEKRREEKRLTTESRADALANARPAKPSAVNAIGTRLDPLWTLPIEWLEWALGERPDWTGVEAERVALVFRDHWHAKPGKEGRKTDWQATWRNWVRNERRRYAAPKGPASLAERRVSTIDRVIAQGARHERVISGTAERVDRKAVPALPVDLRQQGANDVRGSGCG